MIWSNRSPLRFVAFLAVIALLVGYAVWKWSSFNEYGQRTAVNLPLLARWGAGAGGDRPADSGGDGDGVVVNPATGLDLGGTAAIGPLPAADPGDGFSLFIDGRLDRDRSRSQRLALVRDLLVADTLSAAARLEAEEELMILNRLTAYEADIENLLRAKGFDDAVTFLYPTAGVVVVQAESLTQIEAAQVADLVTRVAGTPLAGISVMARPR